ncbi:MAG: glycosyltransferase family 4 protein [Jiangellaceae bacterium]
MTEPVDHDAGRAAGERRVVMIAGNDIIPDVRVLKYAHTVAGFGLDVIAVGLGGPRLTGERVIGDVRIICPPVRERAAVSGWRYRLSAAKPWFSEAEPYRRSLARWEYASAELAALAARDVRDAARSPVIGVELAPPSGTERAARRLRAGTLAFRRRVLAVRARPIRWARKSSSNGTGPGRDLRIRAYGALRLARWRAVMPEVIDAELVLGPLLDDLVPDVIHVHDVYMLGVGARAAQRAALTGRNVKLVYDAHEYVRGTPAAGARRVAAYADLEAEFVGEADRVVTVSEPLANWLQRDYGLTQTPDVVLNAPVDPPTGVQVIGVREVVGVADDVPLLVYGGGVNRARGVNTIVEALLHMPGVHLAIVARGNTVVVDLLKLASRLGVGDRVHVAPYVDPDLVPLYLASASVGVISLLRAPNHDIAVTNKFCEYIAAGLPVITSDTPAQADLVRRLDLGAVYTAGSPASLVDAVHDVLGRRDELQGRIVTDMELQVRFSWRAQAERVRTIYNELIGELPDQAWYVDALHVHDLLGRHSA